MGNHDYFTEGDEIGPRARARRPGVAAQPRRRGEARRRHALRRRRRRHLDRTPRRRSGRSPGRPPARRSCCSPTIRRCSPRRPPRRRPHPLRPHPRRPARAAVLLAQAEPGPDHDPVHDRLLPHGKAALYVNRGLGTTGPPVRLAVAPEIAVLTLRRAAGPLGAGLGGGADGIGRRRRRRRQAAGPEAGFVGWFRDRRRGRGRRRIDRSGGGSVRSTLTSATTICEGPSGISSRSGTWVRSAASHRTKGCETRSPTSGLPS